MKKFWAIYKWWKYNDKWSVLYSKELDDKWANNLEILNLEKYEYGYNVDRSIFDKILLDNFKNKWGIAINKKVINIISEDDKINKLILEDNEEILGEIFIDASWQNSLISSHFNLKIFDNYLKNSSIYAYYKWYKSIDKRLNNYFQYIENLWDCWYWWIPISKDIVSIWIVFNSKRKYTEKDFFEKIKNTEIFSSIKDSILVDFNWNKNDKVNFTWDWSFLSKKAYWENWFLLWDSFWFVDPILSWWVSFAIEKAIYLWNILLLIEKNIKNKEILTKKYELTYKKDVLKYLQMAYCWYKNWNSKISWINESWGSKEDFIKFISGWNRFFEQSKIFQNWQNEKILNNLD